MKQAGIIGGAGFIGTYVTKKFLEEGYRVRVSARNPEKADHYAHLRNLPRSENLELQQLDVRDPDALRKFVRGCDVLVHGGTPFQLEVQDPEKELFEPTIKGTENFLEVIKETPSIKKVVFIASVAAFNTAFPLLPEELGADFVFTEEHPPIFHREHHPYAQAKYLANQTVQQFLADHPDLGFEVVTVSPVGVMGKALSAREDSTSMGLQYLFKHKIAPNPFLQMLFDQDIEFALVDVEDVADGVYRAIVTPGLHGKNYLLSSESWRISDITRLLNGDAPQGKPRMVYSNRAAVRDLGMTFHPASMPLRKYSEE